MPITANEAMKVKDITHLFHHHRRSYRTLSKLLASGRRFSCKELCDASGMSKGIVNITLRHFKEAGFIHIDGWERAEHANTAIQAPLYRVGAKPDAPRPTPPEGSCAFRSLKHREKVRQEALAADGMTEQDAKQFFLSMMHALVPKKAA